MDCSGGGVFWPLFSLDSAAGWLYLNSPRWISHLLSQRFFLPHSVACRYFQWLLHQYSVHLRELFKWAAGTHLKTFSHRDKAGEQPFFGCARTKMVKAIRNSLQLRDVLHYWTKNAPRVWRLLCNDRDCSFYSQDVSINIQTTAHFEIQFKFHVHKKRKSSEYFLFSKRNKS